MLQSTAMANLSGIIKQLEEERSRLDWAIKAQRGVKSRQGASESPQAETVRSSSSADRSSAEGKMGKS